MVYKNPAAKVTDRIEDLLSQMTLDEKIAQLGCFWSTALLSKGSFDPEFAAEKLQNGIGQITRIGASTGLQPTESAELYNAIQKIAVERTRLGIPVILHEESTGGFCHRDATVFPQGIGLAATWNPALVEKVADVIRQQMLAVGAKHTLAPVLDIARDPRWGRLEETYGEDPVLSGAIGVAYVRGLQRQNLAEGVAATGKHFLAYGMSEGGRNWNPVQMGARELREVYAEPFAAVIREAGLATIMNSYASIDGLPCAGSAEILTTLLRDELGFKGVVVADYFAVALLRHYHRVAATPAEAAKMALSAGLDMELPALDCYAALKEEVEKGDFPLEIIDTSVRRVLNLKFMLGLFENPYAEVAQAKSFFQTAEQRALARQAVAESAILLKNEGILPLSPEIKRIAVIGAGADDERLLQGDYHYPAHQEIIYNAPRTDDNANLPRAGGAYAPGAYFTPHVTPLAGLKAAIGDKTEISYAKGGEVLGDDRSGFESAVQIARNAEVVIMVVAGKSGLLRPATVGEGNDATDLELTGVQSELVEVVAATGKPLIVVVMSGRVHTLGKIAGKANALIQLFPPGEEGGNGLADILTGKINPSGRLPVTMPRNVGQIPVHSGYRAGGSRAMFFGDYSDSPTAPLFPLGHGLSYTTFEYGNLAILASDTKTPLIITLDIRNSGNYAGDEVVQLYYRDIVASLARPERMLIGFNRVSLKPNETTKITFTVHPSRLAFYDKIMRFVTEPGKFTFSVGASSADIRAEATVELTGETAQYHQREIIATKAEFKLKS
jgi:beta-glucosidase